MIIGVIVERRVCGEGTSSAACGPTFSFPTARIQEHIELYTIRFKVELMASLPANEIKRIAIVGAGPAGVAAAKYTDSP